MDAITLLSADHDRVRGLFARWQEAADSEQLSRAGELAGQIFEELRVHTAIEEETFYPSVRERGEELAETVEEGLQEHHVVDVLMEEIGGLALDAPEWQPKMTVLIENVEHHAGEEERELFPKVRSAFDAQGLEALAAALTQNKQRLGAPTIEATIDLSMAELQKLASEQQIPGRSKMDHDRLAATVAPR